MLTKEEIENLFLECKNKTDLIRKLNIRTNQNGLAIDNDLLFYLRNIGFTDRKSISKANFNYELNKRKEEKYLLNPKKCPVCGKIITWEKHNNKCCCQSCSTSYSNKKRGKLSEETKQKISKGVYKSILNGISKPKNQYTKNALTYYDVNDSTTLFFVLKDKIKFINDIYCDTQYCIDNGYIKNDEQYSFKENTINAFLYKKQICKICGKEFYGRVTKYGNISNAKTCSDKCELENRRKQSKVSIDKQMKSGTFQGWKPRISRSYAEKFWINVLNNNNISFVSEYPIERKGTQNYFLDFYIEKNGKKIDLEIDGKQHKYLDRKEQDEIRDEYLSSLGYIVYRIDWNKMTGKQEESNETEQKIDKFLDFYNSL